MQTIKRWMLFENLHHTDSSLSRLRPMQGAVELSHWLHTDALWCSHALTETDSLEESGEGLAKDLGKLKYEEGRGRQYGQTMQLTG